MYFKLSHSQYASTFTFEKKLILEEHELLLPGTVFSITQYGRSDFRFFFGEKKDCVAWHN